MAISLIWLLSEAENPTAASTQSSIPSWTNTTNRIPARYCTFQLESISDNQDIRRIALHRLYSHFPGGPILQCYESRPKGYPHSGSSQNLPGQS